MRKLILISVLVLVLTAFTGIVEAQVICDRPNWLFSVVRHQAEIGTEIDASGDLHLCYLRSVNAPALDLNLGGGVTVEREQVFWSKMSESAAVIVTDKESREMSLGILSLSYGSVLQINYLPTTAANITSVSWSPTDKYIAFSGANNIQGHSADIYVLDAQYGDVMFWLDSQPDVVHLRPAWKDENVLGFDTVFFGAETILSTTVTLNLSQ